jgi:hypothetical protein
MYSMTPAIAIATIDAIGESGDTLLVLDARNIHAGVVVEEGRRLERNAKHLDGHALFFKY